MKTTDWFKTSARAANNLKMQGFDEYAHFENRGKELAWYLHRGDCRVAFLTNWKTLKDEHVAVEIWDTCNDVKDFAGNEGAARVWKAMVETELDMIL